MNNYAVMIMITVFNTVGLIPVVMLLPVTETGGYTVLWRS
jgi:hypothetical protein